jgi:GNAT superfamily N-acetyltransferase
MILCRPAVLDDLLDLVEGNQGIAQETEHLTLSTSTLTSGIGAVFDDANRGTYWVAADDHGIIGQLLITFEWSDWRNGQIWWIQSVYVWPRARRQGVFRTLLSEIIEQAKKAGAVELRLYAETTNHRAHKTYLNQGFETGHYQVFEKSLKTS